MLAKKNIYNLIIVVICLKFNVCISETLEDALISGCKTNLEFKMSQQEFLKNIEVFPKAISKGFLPKISAELDLINNTSKASTVKNASRNKNFQKRITISQPIFSSGQATTELSSAKALYGYYKWRFNAEEQKLILKFAEAFLEFYTIKEKYALTESSVVFAEKQLEFAKTKLKLGEDTSTSVAMAEAKLSKTQAERMSIFSNLQKVKAEFKNVIGFEPTKDLVFPDIPGELPKTLEELLLQSNKFNPEILAARAIVEARKFQKFLSIANLLPTANLKASAGNQFFYPPGGIFSQNVNNFSSTVTMSVQIPILSQGGAEFANLREAKSEARKSVYELENAIKSINSNSIFIWESFNALKSSLEYSDNAVKASDLALEGAKEEYALGSKTLLDVLDAQEQSYSSKVKQIETKKQIVLTALQMKLLMGKLTAKNLNLKIKYFDPDAEFRKIKFIIG